MCERLRTARTEAQESEMRKWIREICQGCGVTEQQELQAAQHEDRVLAGEALKKGLNVTEIRRKIYQRRKALRSVHKLRKRIRDLQGKDQGSRTRWMFM